MRLVVTDANIFIDMSAGELLETMFDLPIEFVVPDILYVEELADSFPRLPGYGLHVHGLTEEAIADAEALRTRHPKPGQNDLFALALARFIESPLLTGDADLRRAAESEAVEVHGTLWLMDQLFDQLRLSVDRIERAYRLMYEDGSRLPWSQIEGQLKRFRRVRG